MENSESRLVALIICAEKYRTGIGQPVVQVFVVLLEAQVLFISDHKGVARNKMVLQNSAKGGGLLDGGVFRVKPLETNLRVLNTVQNAGFSEIVCSKFPPTDVYRQKKSSFAM